ncbi:hypothetical protein N8I77_007853 [Diaporthe amygdali]|uniref:Uncharacterized protein n=1 Tax=Phomopsis amygdali TaxID=1214568 RepID=A0AAD9SDW4_PHOAM|nr:hypothetical protein N8I77_007853 [Diaporthe amygdali]
MMEAVAEEQGHLEANKGAGFEDDTVNVIQDEEFDFDIGGNEENLEALGGLESTDEGLTYQTEGNDTLDDAHTHSSQGQGTHEAVDEFYEDRMPDQVQDQHDLEVSTFDASADTEDVDQAYQGDPLGSNTEGENVHHADEAQYGESEKYQEEIYYEETAEELGSFVDAGQRDEEEVVQSTTVVTEHFEYPHQEEERFENEAPVGGASAEETVEMQAVDEEQLPVESDHLDKVIEDEALMAEPRREEFARNTSPEHDSNLVDTVVSQAAIETVDALEDVDDQKAEESKHLEEHPRVRVSYGTAEFYLFAESPDADPDDYFFENTDILDQALSKFLPGLRQVISEDLQASDELFVKVDGLGLEFGEATTKDFLEQTTFGQVLELYDRLVKLDDIDSETPELYIYLETRPNCLHRLAELTNSANEGRGLSQVAFYYEGTPDFVAVEDESNDYDEGGQAVDSDDVSFDEFHAQAEGNLSASHQTGQPYNPFRLSESQQQVINTSNSSGVEGEVVNDSVNELLSAEADQDHPDYDEDDNHASVSGEAAQDEFGLVATDALHDESADGSHQDADMVPGEDEDLTAEAMDDESDGEHYAEDGLVGKEEVAGAEENAEAGNEHSQGDDGPTDGNVLVESEGTRRVSEHRLVEVALIDAQQALVATGDWSSNLPSTVNTQDPLAANHGYYNHKQRTPADFKIQDYNAAENDDYLDIGATEEEPAESAVFAASAGTPGPTSHNSSATATLDGEGHGHGDETSASQALADADNLIQTLSQPELGSPERQTDEIHWNDDDDNDNDNDEDEFDIGNQNQTDLSPSSLSVKRGRQADEDDVGLGDDSTAKRRRT